MVPDASSYSTRVRSGIASAQQLFSAGLRLQKGIRVTSAAQGGRLGVHTAAAGIITPLRPPLYHGSQCPPAARVYRTGDRSLPLAGTAGSRAVQSTHGLLTTVAFQLGTSEPVQYALEGAIGIAGAGVSWLRDNLGIISSAAESETLASS